MDKTTKIILAAIALGLWLNAGVALFKPTPVSAQFARQPYTRVLEGKTLALALRRTNSRRLRVHLPPQPGGWMASVVPVETYHGPVMGRVPVSQFTGRSRKAFPATLLSEHRLHPGTTQVRGGDPRAHILVAGLQEILSGIVRSFLQDLAPVANEFDGVSDPIFFPHLDSQAVRQTAQRFEFHTGGSVKLARIQRIEYRAKG